MGSFTQQFNEISVGRDMFKSILRDRWLLFLIFFSVAIRLFSTSEVWVERYYTNGVYPYISSLLRILLGWIPFSIGDLLYMLAFVYLVRKTWKLLNILRKRQVKEYLSWILVRKLLRLVAGIYLVFNILWGINYNRRGIAEQLSLQVQSYSLRDLQTLTSVLTYKVNHAAKGVSEEERKRLGNHKALFAEALKAYDEVRKNLPFLTYRYPSVKPSFFSSIGHYFGFTGYYNPFSGEAHINTNAIIFLQPFGSTHEIAHQLGYAKENEANFVSFLASRSSKNPEFRYSVYYDMFSYAITELSRRNAALAAAYRQRLHPQVVKDNEALLDYIKRSANAIEPVVSSFYDEYLKMNNQPKGKGTYNEVVAWLVAYGKKYGWDAL